MAYTSKRSDAKKGSAKNDEPFRESRQQVYLISDSDVGILAEGVSLGKASGRVFDQIEGSQLSERHEQFFDLNFE